MNAQVLATIRHYAQKHTDCSIASEIKSVAADDDNQAYQDAVDWSNGHGALWSPEWAEFAEGLDDGNSHDVSSIDHWTVAPEETGLPYPIHIYSYNNNAWGQCDVLTGPDAETPATIEEWLKEWDELPEEWLREYVGEEDEEDDEEEEEAPDAR